MSHELNLRQRAIRLKQAGWAVTWICSRLERSREWFYKWWDRYLEEGAAGLRDRSRAPRTGHSKLPNEIRQAILETRDQLMRRHGPRARYRLAGAATIRHELACLGYQPLPSLRTIDRVLQRGGRTSPAFHPQPRVASHDYPGHAPQRSNQLHQVDLVGPRYLKGSRRQWFFLVYRDVYDGAVYVEFQPKPRLETVLAFVVRAWQRLGLPELLQVDNSDLFGLTSHPGSLNRFVRLALLVGVELTFIPEHEPWRNGSIEYFNGWMQERLFAIQLHSPAQVRRELTAMMTTCFQDHIHPHLQFQTTAQVRKTLTKRSLPHNFC
jgi:putative transposase